MRQCLISVGFMAKRKRFKPQEIPWIRIYKYTICSPMCVAILILALVGYPYFSTTSYFKVGSCCSIQVSFDSHPAAPEMYRNSTWLPGMRWDSMIIFPMQKGVSADFRSLKFGCLSTFELHEPDSSVVFCEQMTHHFDIICIYPAMYVLDDNQNMHQLRPGRQYTLS